MTSSVLFLPEFEVPVCGRGSGGWLGGGVDRSGYVILRAFCKMNVWDLLLKEQKKSAFKDTIKYRSFFFSSVSVSIYAAFSLAIKCCSK